MTRSLLPTRLPPLLVMLLTLLILTVQGCGGGGGNKNGTPNNADLTGYYTNTGFVQVMMPDNTTPRTTTADFQGMVTGSQFMMLSDTDNLTYVGTFTVNGTDFSGTVTLYEAGVMVQENVSMTGMVTEGSKLTGTLSGTGAANGTFELNYAQPTDNGPVDLNMVIRTFDWRPVVNPNIPNLALQNATDDAPAFNFKTGGTGSNVFEGCRYFGRMELIAGTHLYTVSVTMVDCDGQGTGVDNVPEYTGLASMRGTDRFILAMSNGAYDFSGEYFECLVLGCKL